MALTGNPLTRLWRFKRGKRLRGASTISQQAARSLFLAPIRSWVRKGVEAYLTVLIEALWPKQRILTGYLNLVDWGHGNYGAEAASRSYFHKPASDLTRAQAARLATILPDPDDSAGGASRTVCRCSHPHHSCPDGRGLARPPRRVCQAIDPSPAPTLSRSRTQVNASFRLPRL